MDAQLKEFIASNEEEFEHYAEKVWDLARALACTYCETEVPTPEQVSWYIEDADAVAEDVGPGPYSIQKLEAQGNFSSVLVINDWLCGAEEGEGFISLSPISKLPPRHRVITTAEELDALPESAVLLDCFGTAWQKLGGDWVGWLDPGESSQWLVAGKRAPFIVVHEPVASEA